MKKFSTQPIRLRIIMLEANPFVASALTSLFEKTSQFELVSAVPSRAALLKEIARKDIDIAMIAWKFSDGRATELLPELRSSISSLRIIVFSNDDDPDLVRRAVRLGAHGYCYQFDEPEVLFETLHAVSRGRMCVPDIDVTRIAETPLAQLTIRERELLEMLSRGWTNQQISDRTGISENTVKYHLKNLYDKLAVRNRTMAVAVYTREKEA